MLNIEDPSKTLKKDNLITLYPFNGRSPYLMDKFYIIGYNYLTLTKMLIENTPKAIEEEKDKDFKEPIWCSFPIEEEPTILNEITNDYNKEGLDSKTIMQMIFPHRLKVYYTWEENSNFSSRRTVVSRTFDNYSKNSFTKIEFKRNKKIEPKGHRVTFSSNPQTSNNSKKSINGIADIFYRRFLQKKTVDKRNYIFYVPYTFCIISEYPYFSSFNRLFTIIKKFYSQESIYIPIEILIYNIINLSPSPLNSDVILDLSGSCDQEEIFGQLQNDLSGTPNRKAAISLPDKNMINNFVVVKSSNLPKNINLPKNPTLPKVNTEFFEGKREDKLKTKVVALLSKLSNNISNLNPNKNNKIEKNEIEEDNNYKIPFKFLSGYPLIQYNLPKVLFYNLSIEKIITIFLYMFLEKDVLFFSKDINYLTLNINAYLNLNFPLNDEKYYFIGCAISLKDFTQGESEFGLKNYTSVIGINDAFDPEYRNKNVKINDHLVVDLDKGNIILGEEIKDKTTKVDENNKRLVKLIEKMCKDSNDDEKTTSIALYSAIKNLSKRLKCIYEKVYEPSTKKIPGKFLDFSHNIQILTKEIQESFYQFIQHVCLYFYENLTIRATEDEYKNNPKEKEKWEKNDDKENKVHEMNVIFDEKFNNEKKYNEEELLFLEELKDTMKYQSFVFVFLQSYNPIDLYKIPLTFTEEFLSIITRKKEEIKRDISKIQFFKLIDNLYLTRKNFDQKEVNFITTNFSYFRNLKNKFDREIYDRDKKRFNHDSKNIVKFVNNQQRVLMYQTFELDDNILLNYIHLIKSLSPNDYIQMFSNSFYIEENILNKIDVTNIETLVENNCIKENILSKSDICCSNIFILFAISLKSLRETIDCQTFLGILFQKFTVFRKYYSILLRTIYKLIQSATKEKKNNYLGTTTLCYYPCINSIRSKKLVPNEDLMNMIIQFNKINISELSLSENNNNSTKKKEKEENIEGIQLYGEQLEEKDITYSNLYVYNNFNSQQFFREKDIVEYVNRTNQFEMVTNTGERVFPQIRFYNGIHKIESLFLSQKDMLESLIKEYAKYIDTLDDSKLNSKIILDACLNIFIYMRNTEEFEGMDDIFETLKSIFYIFMNQLFILKSEKENIEKRKNQK